MKLSQFNFDLPQTLIADHPLPERDKARLMVVNRQTGEISHHIFNEIIDFFDEDDVMIFNNTRVFPALLYGNKEKTGARIEVFLLRELSAENKFWDVLVEPARKIRIGNKLYFGDDDSLVAEVIDNTTSRGRTLRFLYDGPHDEFKAALYALGHPSPPVYQARARALRPRGLSVHLRRGRRCRRRSRCRTPLLPRTPHTPRNQGHKAS